MEQCRQPAVLRRGGVLHQPCPVRQGERTDVGRGAAQRVRGPGHAIHLPRLQRRVCGVRQFGAFGVENRQHPDAFRPYSPLLAAMAGVCNWWGWTATAGLCATTMATILGPTLLPGVPAWLVACGAVLAVLALARAGLRAATGASLLLAGGAGVLAAVSLLTPVLRGSIDPARLTDIHLTQSFPGPFGKLTSVMAGLFLVGYAAPFVEAALCYAGDLARPGRDTRRALVAILSAGTIFFIVLPAGWLAALGAAPLGVPMDRALRAVFPVGTGTACADGLMVLCLLQAMLQALSGPPRVLAQLAADGMAPRFLGWPAGQRAPQAATLVTALATLVIAVINDTVWLQGAANFAYLIGLFLPGLAVWLLRRDRPDAPRPWRAPRGMVGVCLAASLAWLVIAVLGSQQFGLPTIVLGIVMAYSGAALFALRKLLDRRRGGAPGIGRTLYVDVMVPLLVVLSLDAVGYIVALSRLGGEDPARVAGLEDIFVAVALLSLSVGVVLPGRIAHAAEQVSDAARRLAHDTLREFSTALDQLGRGDLESARPRADLAPVPIDSSSELGEMASSFNTIQAEVTHAAQGLERARQGLIEARNELTAANQGLRTQILEQERLAGELVLARDAAEAGERSKAEFLAMISHELRTPLNGVIGMAGLLLDGTLDAPSRLHAKMLRDAGNHLLDLINDLLDFSKLDADQLQFETVPFDIEAVAQSALDLLASRAHAKSLEIGAFVAPDVPAIVMGDPGRLRQVLLNLLGNAVKSTKAGALR